MEERGGKREERKKAEGALEVYFYSGLEVSLMSLFSGGRVVAERRRPRLAHIQGDVRAFTLDITVLGKTSTDTHPNTKTAESQQMSLRVMLFSCISVLIKIFLFVSYEFCISFFSLFFPPPFSTDSVQEKNRISNERPP